MATASFSFTPGSIPLGRQPYQIGVLRFTPPGSFQYMPNVQALNVAMREGEPGSARFRYVLSDLAGTPYPSGFEKLIGVNASSPYAVKVDDRLIVAAISPDTGQTALLFDGFAQSPEVGMGPQGQQVTFSAAGTAIRCWDQPLNGAAYRDADSPTEGAVTATELPLRLNPSDSKGLTRPNSTPFGCDFGGFTNPVDPGDNGSYPVFVDASIDLATEVDAEESDDEDEAVAGDTRRPFTLGMFAKYLLWTPHAGGGNGSQRYVMNPNTINLESELMAIDFQADATGLVSAVASDIIARDQDLSNKPWPAALRELIWPYGFRYRFVLEADESDDSGLVPKWTLKTYRRDGLLGPDPKPLKLQQSGEVLDPGLSNVGSINVARTPVRFNRVVVESEPILYEISVVLSPGFPIDQADSATPAAMKLFDKSNWGVDFANNQANKRKYRFFVLDECGDGHWNLATSAWVVTPWDNTGSGFNAVFAPDKVGKDRIYPRRYRPGRNELITTLNNTALGEPLKSQLHVSADYKNAAGILWDGTGTWQAVSGGWRLLRDRLGIYIDIDNPNSWNIGNAPADSTIDKLGSNGKLNLVERLSNPSTTKPLVYLRLTTVIQGDFGINAVAARRTSTSSQFSMTTRVDGRDHFRKTVVDISSPYSPNKGADAKQIVVRDDTAKAQAYANSLRDANDVGWWEGSVTIPRLSLAYQIGDPISGITGRNATFQVNAGSAAGANPIYPVVSGITYNFENQQSTTLEFSSHPDQPMTPK